MRIPTRTKVNIFPKIAYFPPNQPRNFLFLPRFPKKVFAKSQNFKEMEIFVLEMTENGGAVGQNMWTLTPRKKIIDKE